MTPFGAKLRQIRKDRKIALKTMAHALDVSPAYLSALEHGHRGPPNLHFVQRVILYFNVIWDDAEELERLAALSHPRVVINTAGLNPAATEFANILATSINDLHETDLEELIIDVKQRLIKQRN